MGLKPYRNPWAATAVPSIKYTLARPTKMLFGKV
jgi:hypothetical protein